MRRAVIIDAVRTPIARASAETGYYRDVRADDLSADLIRALVARTGIAPALIEDVRWGCVMQHGEQGYDIARIAALLAGLPPETAGVTVNRNCASGLQALNDCALSIAAGAEDVQIAGGVEHMDHLPMTEGYAPNPALFRRHSEAIMHMGLTAEFLARSFRIDRAAQDAFAARSHHLAARAADTGEFDAEIVPTLGRDRDGHRRLLADDQSIRRDTSPEALAALPPAFDPAGGSVTAGNSSPLSVGAAALLLMSEDTAAELGLTPMARVVATAVAGVEPEVMGLGPVPAVHKVLARAGVSLGQVECIELNEAFAVQVLAVLKQLGLPEDRVNARGGALALGHPLGASGARIVTTLLHRMRAQGARYGLATLCVGQGQGVATLFEAA